MERIEKGDYATYQSQPTVVLVREVQYLFKNNEAYPWLIRAMDSADSLVAETVRYEFAPTGMPGAIEPESMLEWYHVPDNELVWTGTLWEPCYGRTWGDDPESQEALGVRCRGLIARIEAGQYGTFNPEANRKPGLVIIREMQEIFQWRAGYPWLIAAVGSSNAEIRNTALYYFAGAQLPGPLTPDRLRIWYDVPDSELQRMGGIWRPRIERLEERDGALWNISGFERKLERLADAGQYEKATGGSSLYYVFFDRGKKTLPLCVIECAQDGVMRRIQEFDRNEWREANAIERMTWLGGSRIFVETHVNPSLGIGVDIDLDSRKTNVFHGARFTWNASRTRLAYFREPPHFGAPPDAPSKLMVGREEICELPRRPFSELFWNAEGRVLAAVVPPDAKRSAEMILVTFPDNAPWRVERFELRPSAER